LSQVFIEAVTQSRFNFKTKTTKIILDSYNYNRPFICCFFIYYYWNK